VPHKLTITINIAITITIITARLYLATNPAIVGSAMMAMGRASARQ